MLQVVVSLLKERGVALTDVAEIVYSLQKPYVADLSKETCLESVSAVLGKREVQNALLTGIYLDQMAEQGRVPEPLATMLRRDDPLYGVDEILALAITNVYGSIGLTSFGYLDKAKTGILAELDQHLGGRVHTFLDDLVAGLAAAAAARIAHQHDPMSPKKGRPQDV